MTTIDPFKDSQTTKKRKTLNILLIIFISYHIIFDVIHLPISLANWFVPFKVGVPQYIPFHVDDQYAKISGFNRVQFIFKNEHETLTVWATNDQDWIHYPDKRETYPLNSGQLGYYSETGNIQTLNFKKDAIHYSMDYEGSTLLSKNELRSIANSIE